MGNTFTGILQNHLWMQDQPIGPSPRKYDPEFGFDSPREKMGPKATRYEMDVAGLQSEVRDVCVDQRIRFYGCQHQYPLMPFKCKGYLEEIQHCYHEWAIHDMKEFEREKRLNRRERLLREASMKE